MKILLVNDYGTATGGAELQILSLREELRDRGHDARLFSSDFKTVASSPLLSDYSCFGTNTQLQVLLQTVNPSAYFRLREILEEFNPDIVHVRIFLWQLSPLILPLLENRPCLYQTAVYKAICPTGIKILPNYLPCQNSPGLACLRHRCLTPQSWAVLMLQRQLWRQWRHAFDLVVALSHTMKAKLEAEGISPVKVVYNGVPERQPRPSLISSPTVAFAGRLAREKGVDILLRAFAGTRASVPDVRLLIAGQGSEEESLRLLSRELGIVDSITWLGHIPRQELEQSFNSAWVQVVPSLWDEPFGNVTTEAMMRGTAVIASAVGAQPEIVRDGMTGFLVPPNNVEALQMALISLLIDRSLAEQMGRAGRQVALTDFSENRRTDGFLEIYQQLRAAYQN